MEKEDLSLSLSLSTYTNHFAPSSSSSYFRQRMQWNLLLPSSSGEAAPGDEAGEAERGGCSSQGISDEDEDGDGCRKKLRLSRDQSAVLEDSFKEHTTLNPKLKAALAKQLNLRPRQVEVWFQNRRARTKLKQTEVDCEFLKKCCENLTEENRRLHKEVQELRALKLSPQVYMQMTPPTTLTMCPSCDRRLSNSTATAVSSPAEALPQHRRLRANESLANS
ncbi:homeobox-leucine zipper protein HOX17-like [Zingiber officinale]|uniref:homeobox-leucine zipper protein HOX17-like n=1 Tax=Zingiber officinale TaxID=94328 RepID=UPI001C4BF099|nr:homeobox-leucine zipper protein HOX17-like [Zingiber officinale]